MKKTLLDNSYQALEYRVMHEEVQPGIPIPQANVARQRACRDNAVHQCTSENILACHDRDNSVRWHHGERLHHLFEARCDQFARLGDVQHIAVESGERTWSYHELDCRANQLARHLKQHGLGPGDIIGLLLDKSVHSYVSMLAVLKIHAAYVPLDPGFPPDRLAFITSDAGLRAIITISQYRSLLEDMDIKVMCIDEESEHIDFQEGNRLDEHDVGKPVNELCYIIYTSGSTGQPKGVPIEHANICNFVRVAAEVYGYRSDDRVYQGLTIAFDFAVEEIWVPLVSGATLLPNQTGTSLVGRDLAIFLRNHRITALCCVPTLLATIDEALPDLRLLIVSGEACPSELVSRWYHPKRTILNAYGPTETTVTATVASLCPEKPVTIGRPLPTYSIVILEPGCEHLLPFGETGEICIAGIGVTYGYLNREDQTRKSFIRDFLQIPNNTSGLIYRTGDLGRINGDGELEYLGRIDTQVKVRGYRIELTEIESVILRIPQIAQAAVNTYESRPGVIDLVAYYTFKTGAPELSQADISNVLRLALPGYSVPVYYEKLSSFPMLASDKVDRKSLPPPSSTRMNTAGREFIEPQGELETRLAAVLGRILNLEKVSAEDDFFNDLGANSLLMAEFSAGLHDELGIVESSMREIYLHPSIRKLSAFLETKSQKQTPLRRSKPCYIASNWQYLLCGALQLSLMFVWIYCNFYVFLKGFDWIISARTWPASYERAVIFAIATFSLAVFLPVALKWILIGRWKPEEFPVWSFKYLRFWVVKRLVQLNPIVLFAGTPLYIAYLKMLGARVSWKAAVFSPTAPVCTDLITIGDYAVIAKNVLFPGYRAESGRITTGRVTLERNTYVGEASVLDINTVMESGSELAHASSLHEGQRLAAGHCYHGSPAQPATCRYRQLESSKVSPVRMIVFSVSQLIPVFLLYIPAPFLLIWILSGSEHYHFSTSIANATGHFVIQLPGVLAWSSLAYLGMILSGLVLITTAPRFLNKFIHADRIYPLYGIHYYLHRLLLGISNSRLYNILFGDSSFIVHYLGAIGYRFKGLEQTGSNFGLGQRHENPFLCEIGKGTIISDGFVLLNTNYSASTFRTSRVSIGARNFLGNNIFYPAHGMTGDNCLLGTKVMVPTDGPLRENTGLLGSPCFEIPRTVQRDGRFDLYQQKDKLRQRLKQKNISNSITIFFYLITNCITVNIFAAGVYYAFRLSTGYSPGYYAALGMILLIICTLYYIFINWASLGFRRLQPQYCSIYEPYYWKHERYWKIGMRTEHFFLDLWNGTPFKNLVWRALGVRVGKKLFDDGGHIPEMSLVKIGDYCTLNDYSVLQGHSLEDGIFKSDRISIGNACTIGTNAFVHYGVQMGDEVNLGPDSFLMKGERPAPLSSWSGNPAREMLVPSEA